MKLQDDKVIMQRCFAIARNGVGKVSPNPMVGCVIVRDGKIIGEGFHKQFGGPHAEILALLHARKKARGSTLYVNLEPCVHFGKTPPCVDAIIQSGVSRVVMATKDPNPLVDGKGIRRLREVGIQVEVGTLRKEAELLNEKFFKFMKSGLPFVGIKLAQTLDGRIADCAGRSKWITSDAVQKEVHRLRSEYDVVLAGARTVLIDNPELTVRLVKRRNPVRVVVDGRLSIPVSFRVFNTTVAPTWVLTSSTAMKFNSKKVRKLTSRNVRVFGVASSTYLNPESILRLLSSEGISSVLIEGGSQTAAGFIKRSLADKLYLYTAPKIFGGGLDAIRFDRPRKLFDSIKLKIVSSTLVGGDLFVEANFIK